MGVFDWLKGRRAAGSAPLQGWHLVWANAVERSDSGTAEQLRRELDAAGLAEEEIEVEREMLDGLVALCELAAGGDLPVIETGHRAAAGARCHFSSPVSMPDEPGQPSGRLLLTAQRAVFAGPGSAAVPWHAVVRAVQTDRDIVLVHRGQDRTHRFRCNSYTDALTGAHIARRLIVR